MGAGVASMHYTGMAAMRMSPGILYDPALFCLSVVIAMLASGAALWIAFRLRRQSRRVRAMRAGAAVVMGLAIVGMHYTGMAAAGFPLGSICGAARGGASAEWLALVIIVVTLAVLAMALLISVLDLRMEARTAVLATSLAKANRELAYLALHDSLTKLSNRLLLEDRLDQAIQAAGRNRGSFALMFLDLDGFKAINDVYGHHAGDLLLADVARRIVACVRQQDTVARVGGDEFVVLAGVGEPRTPGPWPTPCWPPCARRSWWTGTHCGCRPASASRSIRTTAPASTICSPMPTRRCTTPRAWAAIRTASSRRR